MPQATRGARSDPNSEHDVNSPQASRRDATLSEQHDQFGAEQDVFRLAADVGRGAHASIAQRPAMIERKRGSAFEVSAFPIFLLLVIAVVGGGWVFREELRIESESGFGYWLGVAGLSCVGVLLIYPLRKRIPGLGFIGSIPAWFHFHMSLGLLAPALILFHAGFRIGSVNAAIALASMLVVAGSGP